MKINFSKRTIGIGIAVVLGVGLLLFLKRGPQQPGAVVNGERIDMAPIAKRIEGLAKADPGRFAGESGAQEVEYLTQMFLTDAISAKAAQQAALKAGVTVSEAEIDREIDVAARSYKNRADFVKAQLEQGVSEANLRDMLSGQIAIGKMRIKLAKEARVQPGETGAYIAESQKDFESPVAQAKLSVITVEDDASARAVLAALKKGADFDKLAKEKSVDKEIDIGWHPTSYLEQVLAGAVEATPVGAYTADPFPNPDNTVSIYRVEDKQTRMSTEDEKQAQVERRILRFRQAYSFKQWYKEATKNAKIERF